MILSHLPQDKVRPLKNINVGDVVQVTPTEQIDAIVYNELPVTQVVQNRLKILWAAVN